MSYSQRFTIEGNALARRLIEEAIALSPDDAEGYARLASTRALEYFFGSAKSPQESFEKALELAEKSIALDDTRAQTHGLLSMLYSLKREHDTAIAEAERAMALDPGGADVHAWLGQTLNYVDKPEEAIPFFEKAIRLNPFGPAWYFLNFGLSYQLTARYQEAVSQYKKALHVASDNILAHLGLAGTYSLSGRDEDARAEVDKVLTINPRFSLESFAKFLPLKNQARLERLIEALRKAGLK